MRPERDPIPAYSMPPCEVCCGVRCLDCSRKSYTARYAIKGQVLLSPEGKSMCPSCSSTNCDIVISRHGPASRTYRLHQQLWAAVQRAGLLPIHPLTDKERESTGKLFDGGELSRRRAVERRRDRELRERS